MPVLSGVTNIGTGATVTFGTTTIKANVTGVSWSGLSRESVPTSHLATTGGMTFMPGDLYDPGELSIDIQFDPDMTADADIVAAAETVTVTFPFAPGESSTNASWAATGFITSVDMDTPLEDVMTGSITVKFSGAITTTPGA